MTPFWHLQQILSSIFTFLAVCGFLFQILQITNLFLSHNMNTEVVIEMPEEIHPPAVSICVRYADILDIKQIFKDTNFRIPNFKKFPPDFASLQARMNLTVAQIFNYTPAVEHFFQYCSVREKHGYNLVQLNGSNCLSLFNTKKFYVQEFVCYMLDPSPLYYKNHKYLYKMSAYSINLPNAIYQITPNTTAFTESYVVQTCIHLRNYYPGNSYPHSARYIFHSRARLEYTYSKVTIERLPYPFATDCRRYRFPDQTLFTSNRLGCHNICVYNYTVHTLRKVPFSSIIPQPLDMRHVNQLEMTNVTLEQNINQYITSVCDVRCAKLDCKKSEHLTQYHAFKTVSSTTFVIKIPDMPFQNIKFKPAMQTIELVVYIMSCVGAWFGISVLSLNPVSFVTKILQKKRNPRKEPLTMRFAMLRIAMKRNKNDNRRLKKNIKLARSEIKQTRTQVSIDSNAIQTMSSQLKRLLR